MNNFCRILFPKWALDFLRMKIYKGEKKHLLRLLLDLKTCFSCIYLWYLNVWTENPCFQISVCTWYPQQSILSKLLVLEFDCILFLHEAPPFLVKLNVTSVFCQALIFAAILFRFFKSWRQTIIFKPNDLGNEICSSMASFTTHGRKTLELVYKNKPNLLRETFFSISLRIIPR